MLGVLCAARPKPWILNSIAHFHHLHHLNPRCFSLQTHFHFVDSPSPPSLRHHSTSCRLDGSSSSSSSSTAAGGGAASIWHLIQPCGSHKTIGRPAEPRGEGSWNVAWDARPARWLHRADSSAWLLFGVCACLAPIDFWTEPNTNLKTTNDDKIEDDGDSGSAGGFIAPAPAPAATASDVNNEGSPLSSSSSSSSPASSSADYKVTGVLADGRCLFRAIAHGACLRNGEEAPDENRQRELADELRAQVVDELLRRRKEVEWFIEDDFDAYVKRIQQPYVWGGEPELLMASHVLKTMISVFMVERPSGNLVSIANYGEEYRKDEVNPINVLFHGYGHYDLLETSADKICQKVNAPFYHNSRLIVFNASKTEHETEKGLPTGHRSRLKKGSSFIGSFIECPPALTRQQQKSRMRPRWLTWAY